MEARYAQRILLRGLSQSIDKALESRFLTVICRRRFRETATNCNDCNTTQRSDCNGMARSPTKVNTDARHADDPSRPPSFVVVSPQSQHTVGGDVEAGQITELPKRVSGKACLIGCAVSTVIVGLGIAILVWNFGPGSVGSGGDLTVGYHYDTEPHDVVARVTSYGAKDNCPPGPAISYGSVHSDAGGAGTYTDPITFAGTTSAMPAGTRIYVPRLQKYFILEDHCQECNRLWHASAQLHFDLWMGPPSVLPGHALIDCEIAHSKDGDTVQINPPADLPVNAAPMFSATILECALPTDHCVDVGVECGNSCEIPAANVGSCAQLATLFSLSPARFAELNPQLSCSGVVSVGTSVCMGGTCGD